MHTIEDKDMQLVEAPFFNQEQLARSSINCASAEITVVPRLSILILLCLQRRN